MVHARVLLLKNGPINGINTSNIVKWIHKGNTFPKLLPKVYTASKMIPHMLYFLEQMTPIKGYPTKGKLSIIKWSHRGYGKVNGPSS